MSNNRILFIAPASIPVFAAEAIVNIKLLKLLVSKGYKIDVISKKAKWERYPMMFEEELQHKLSSVTIIEVSNRINISSLWLHLRAWLRFGVLFKGIHWAFLASQKAKVLLRENNYSCVMTKNTPSEIVGRWIKRHYGTTWLATWNDPYPLERFPEPYGKGPNAKLFILKKPLLKQMREADAHIYPSSRLRDYMQRYMCCAPEKTFVIPHIVDSIVCNPRESDGILKICYIGSLVYARKPWTVLDAISLYKQKYGTPLFKVDFIGDVPSNMMDVVGEKQLNEIVSVRPPVSYMDSMNLLSHYDVSMIIEAPCEEGIFLPSKVSDAMAVGLTIFAVSPSVGVLHDLYENKNIQYFSDVTSVHSIFNSFEEMVNDFKYGNMKRSSVPCDYEAEFIFEQYASIIDN